MELEKNSKPGFWGRLSEKIKKNKRLFILLLIFLALIVIAICLYVWRTGKEKEAAKTSSGNTTATESTASPTTAPGQEGSGSTTTKKSGQSGSQSGSGGGSGSSSTTDSSGSSTPTAFAVTAASLSVDRTWIDNAGSPDAFHFTGSITTNTAGTVTYKWLRTPPIYTPNTSSLVFDSAGTRTIPYDWDATCTTPETFYRSLYLQIFTPNSLSSNTVNVTLHCL